MGEMRKERGKGGPDPRLYFSGFEKFPWSDLSLEAAPAVLLSILWAIGASRSPETGVAINKVLAAEPC